MSQPITSMSGVTSTKTFSIWQSVAYSTAAGKPGSSLQNVRSGSGSGLLCGTNSKEDMLQEISDALDKDPSNPVILHERAICLLNMGKLIEALVCLDLSICIEPNAPAAHITRAACLINANQPLEAIKSCDLALALGTEGHLDGA